MSVTHDVGVRGVPLLVSFQEWATNTEINLWMHPANERWRYIVTSSLIGWAQTQNDPCKYKAYSWRNMSTMPDNNQGFELLKLKGFYQKSFSKIRGCDWLMLLHLPIMTKHSAKSFFKIFNLVLLIGFFRSSYNAFSRIPRGLTDDESTLVQVMAWCWHHMVSLGHKEFITSNEWVRCKWTSIL